MSLRSLGPLQMLLALAGICVSTGLSQAGTVSLVSMHYSVERFVPHFHYEGPVLEGDLIALAALMDQYVECDTANFPSSGGNCAVLTMDSPGGNYIEGLRMAHFLRDASVATVVEADTSCYSACAFAFLGGSGFSTQDGVGAYIDRMVEPTGILGFHAPYFAPESLDGLVATNGLDEVLGATRDDISLMVQQLVDWNVDANVLGHIVGMGPDETYDVLSGEDFYLTRIQLPPAPLTYWITTQADALRNACIALLAYQENALPSAVLDKVDSQFQDGIATTTTGTELSGFRLGADNPLDVTFCALPSEQAGLDGDVDLALYTAPGITGELRALASMFHRPEGWSSLGTGGQPTRSIFQKGGLTQLFMPVEKIIDGGFIRLVDYFPARKFASFTQTGMVKTDVTFPSSDIPVMPTTLSARARSFDIEAIRIHEQVGSRLLFDAARDPANQLGLLIDYRSESDSSFYFTGTYPSGRAFAWLGFLINDNLSSFTVLETTGPGAPGDNAGAELDAYSCTMAFEGASLNCS